MSTTKQFVEASHKQLIAAKIDARLSRTELCRKWAVTVAGAATSDDASYNIVALALNDFLAAGIEQYLKSVADRNLSATQAKRERELA